MKKIDKKLTFTKNEYLAAIANWKWFFNSGAAKPQGYIISENIIEDYKCIGIKFQKHKCSRLTTVHMILHNLIRGKELHRGFESDQSNTFIEAIRQIEWTYNNTNVAIAHLTNNLKGKESSAIHYARQLSRAMICLTKFAEPFGFTAEKLIKILALAM